MLSILIPVYNEQDILCESVEKLISYLDSRNFDYEILILNNGSTDRTLEIAQALANSKPHVRAFSLPKRDVGGAFVKGVREARGEIVVTQDADLSSDLVFIDYSHDLLQYADALVGSKTMGSQRRSLVRVLGSQLYILLVQLFFKMTISDYSMGAKAFRKDSITAHLDGLDPWTGYIFELCLRLHRSGAKVIQIGIDCNDLRPSHFNLLHEGVYRYWHLFKCWRRLDP
ncbi:MAG: glycosyltransferase family 2 protein [Bdellovibrionales bacterium]|nr:glycosyltransferase family 2 protein [Bdellovibrionales bacterium]